MRGLVLCALFFFSACATQKNNTDHFGYKAKFELLDSSGKFILTREVKTKGNKLISRIKIFDLNMVNELESTVSVSRVGYKNQNRDDILLLPDAAQFKVWFEKEEYLANTKISPRGRVIKTQYKDPENKQGKLLSHNLPKGKAYCFFSQIPECVKIQRLIFKAQKEKVSLYVIWDNFPYHTEQYENMSSDRFVLADFYLKEKNKNELKYSLDLGNQIIFYHFDNKLNFEKMFWVAQGLSLTRK